ncbi:hypothetical protein SADUNF_Sadunf01G0185200 [Salix dunnii]|uniref:Uncharacterized protein n=1 Tax=Salix dunnii TaxID=1413687 RepID=A0A835NCL7_9ROSI|nr:hypothetical protein SADUNF_Sadunf01G0185200 [Salix dunnii]
MEHIKATDDPLSSFECGTILALIEYDAEGIDCRGFVECLRENIYLGWHCELIDEQFIVVKELELRFWKGYFEYLMEHPSSNLIDSWEKLEHEFPNRVHNTRRMVSTRVKRNDHATPTTFQKDKRKKSSLKLKAIRKNV